MKNLPLARYVAPGNCPECKKETVFVPVGIYRSQCTGCHALVKNEELDVDSKPG